MINKPKLNRSLTEDNIFNYQKARQAERESIPHEELKGYDDVTQNHSHAMSKYLGATMSNNAKLNALIAYSKALKEHKVWKSSFSQPFVFMSNALVVSTHGLDLHEKRLMALAMSKIILGFNYLKPIKVTEKEYKEIFNHSHDSKYSYRTLKQAAINIAKSKIVWKDPFLQEDLDLHRWVSSIEYHSGTKASEKLHTGDGAHVIIYISQPLVEHLQSMDDGEFTTFKLLDFAKLQTKYGQRLFENLKRFISTGFLRVKIVDFCRIMEVSAGYLRDDGKPKDFGNINNRVIKPAINDLSKLINVVVTPGKSGKAVSYIDFTFKKEGAKPKKPSMKEMHSEREAKYKKVTSQYKTRNRLRNSGNNGQG